ncbi:TonB-dependent receptor plug domain-containing protein [Lentiprolixibacter aurantiacus]|uniref:TonB-dependent receptor n=1 Tax=Lentiprolixibacter aurantiacus TaxID=2993939 RepID=A0AAE3MJ14_9FLAO|nr:TonB-dependent receptor [Lentiprolixibacter aurantiacus]MCX2718333.1 TonB-dependent receptor [Lentiprolixibacter aurantiacus]
MKSSTNIRGILFLLLLFPFHLAIAQKVYVLDAESEEGIGNVIVYNEDRSGTVITGIDGSCDLEIFKRTERLTFRHMGYLSFKATKAQILRQNSRVYLNVNPQQLEEVVMSISKWEQQKKDIPQKIASIDARSITFNNPQTSADLLQSSGKVYVQKSQLGGGSPMIRGFATNRLLLSVDGVRMNNAIFRGGNIQNVISIDPFTVKNTEVIFGPGSVIYGSDAIGGVMNFFTKKPMFASYSDKTFSGMATYRHATANNENTIHLDLNFGRKTWAFLSSITYNDFGDLQMGKNGPREYLRDSYVVTENNTDILRPNPNPRRQLPSGYNQLNLMQKISHKPNNSWEYDLNMHYSETSDYSRYDRLIRPNRDGTGLRSAEWFYGPQKWWLSNLQVYKKGRGKFYDGVKLTTAYQYFEESRNERNFANPIRYSTLEKLNALSANLDFENKKIGNFRMYYGAEYVFNQVASVGSQTDITDGSVSNSPSRYPDGAIWQTLAGYVNGEYKLKPNLTFLAGMRYSHVWTQADFDTTFYPFPFDETSLSNGALTGSLGFSWFPKADLQFTLNGSTGFRSPNIDDIGKVFDSEPGAVVVPNPDLEPEYAYNVELGVKKNFQDKLVLKGATYYTYLVDALVRRNFEFDGESEIIYNGELSRVQAIQNAAKAYVYGLELGLQAFLTDQWSLTANYTLTDGREEDQEGVDSPVRHVAPTFGDLHLLWKNQWLETDFFLNYNGELSFDDLAVSERNKPFLYAVDSNGNPYSPSWYTLNFRSRIKISNGLTTSLIVENMTNQLYRTYSSGISAPGFNLITGLSYKF